GLIKRVRHIHAPDVAAAEPAQISDANTVQDRTYSLVDHTADRRRAHQETVVIVMEAGVVFVERANKFRGVAGKKEVLQINIAENNLLMALVENGIQAAIRIFLEQIEIRCIV